MPVSEIERSNARPIPFVPRLIFATRWLQLPLYIGLILAQAVYVYHFWVELVHLVEAALGDAERSEHADQEHRLSAARAR